MDMYGYVPMLPLTIPNHSLIYTDPSVAWLM